MTNEKSPREQVDDLIAQIAHIVEENNVVITKYVLVYEAFDADGDRYPSCIVNHEAMCYETLGLINWMRVREEEHIADRERHRDI